MRAFASHYTREQLRAVQGVLLISRPPPAALAPSPGQPTAGPSDPEEGEEILLAVWDDGSGSEIVVYQPCKNPEATCASIKTIKKAKKRADEPAPATPVR